MIVSVNALAPGAIAGSLSLSDTGTAVDAAWDIRWTQSSASRARSSPVWTNTIFMVLVSSSDVR
ncbi:MAG TPA: hypothetical protein PKH71_05430, partial [Methanoregulaceae archaeon]|nr:hypothetical protein [Methanoregulaceae archaeon]